MITASTSTERKSLKSPELKEQLQRLRQTDNYRNFYYLLRRTPSSRPSAAGQYGSTISERRRGYRFGGTCR